MEGLMPEPERLLIRVASLLWRPRALPPAQAEDVYRGGEALALGLDMALAAGGVRRTQLIGQRVNRQEFAEEWTPPGDLARGEAALLRRESGGDPDPAQTRTLIGEGKWPTRFPHLLGHAGSPWYYVARAFDHPLWVPEPRPQSHTGGGPPRTLSIGSSSALADELEALAAFLSEHGLDLDTYFPAPLLEATAVSLETGLVIIVEMVS
jgi:hypothetical protein